MAETVADVCLSHIDRNGPELYVINPTANLLSGLIDSIGSAEPEPPEMRILSAKQRMSGIANRFKIAAQLADFVEQDIATIRTIEGYQRNSMLISDGLLSFYPATGESEPAFSQTADSGVGELMERVNSEWDDSSAYPLRTPPISRLVETMENDLGAAFKHDFDSALVDIPEISTGSHEISITTLILLVAARNDLMLYDLGRWSEGVELTSKATLSRKKAILEDNDAISTSKVSQDVGRPRLKLHLNEWVATKWDETNADEAIRAVMDRSGETDGNQ